jgi:hypothetical protein
MLDKPKRVIESYTKQLYSVTQDVDTVSSIRTDFNADCAEESSSVDPYNWRDYRKDIIDSSSTPNTVKISKFSDTLLFSESFGTGKANIKSA